MKKIIIAMALGLVVGFGVTTAIENTDISELEAENTKVKQQLAKLSKQVLVLQKQAVNTLSLNQRQGDLSLTQRQNSKALTGNTLHQSKVSREAKFTQRNRVMAQMRAQQKATAQVHPTEQNKHTVKKTKDGVVL